MPDNQMSLYGFRERLAMSQGVSASDDIKATLLANVPGAVRIDPATNAEDRSGTDWWVVLRTGQKISIDVKVREDDYKKLKGWDDLALEAWSVIGDRKPGWTRDETKRTDYILWWWKPTRRWCLVPFRMLCAVYIEFWVAWLDKYRSPIQETRENGRSWRSQCTFVPRRLVWAEIYKRFSGDREPQKN